MLWKTFDLMQKRIKEKDVELLAEIDKRDKRLDASQKVFHDFAERTRESTMKHIADNTTALINFTTSVKENTRVTQQLGQHLSEHHPAPTITQVNVDSKPKNE